MSKKLSQKKKVLSFLRNTGHITPYQAFKYFGCLRLSERIRELKADGKKITNVNKSGYAKYVYEE